MNDQSPIQTASTSLSDRLDVVLELVAACGTLTRLLSRDPTLIALSGTDGDRIRKFAEDTVASCLSLTERGDQLAKLWRCNTHSSLTREILLQLPLPLRSTKQLTVHTESALRSCGTSSTLKNGTRYQ